MRRLLKPLEDWSVEDVEALITERVPESQRLDYKQELVLSTREQRKEAAKDASGLANASGGLLIYGMAEDQSPEPVPVELTPLDDRGVQAQLEDLLDDAVLPALNLETHVIDAGDGFVLLVRVHQRSCGPHMVQGYGQHRYFVRRGLSTRPMTEDEVRAAYRAASHMENGLMMRVRDLPLMPRITRKRSFDDLAKAADGHEGLAWLPWVSVVTVPLDAPEVLIQRRRLDPYDFPETREGLLENRAIRGSGPYQIDAFGYLEEQPIAAGDPRLHYRSRIYRSGVCEWGRRWPENEDGRTIPSWTFAVEVHNVLLYFASVYEELDYHGRLALWVRIDNAHEATFLVNSRDFRREAPLVGEFINFFTTTTADDLTRDPLDLTHQAMDLIWQGFGFSDCQLFDENGNLENR